MLVRSWIFLFDGWFCVIYEKMGGWYPQKETNISSHSICFVSDVENGGEALMEDQFDDADNDDNMEQ